MVGVAASQAYEHCRASYGTEAVRGQRRDGGIPAVWNGGVQATKSPIFRFSLIPLDKVILFDPMGGSPLELVLIFATLSSHCAATALPK